MVLSKILRTLTFIAAGMTYATNLWAHSKTVAVLPFVFKHSEPEPRKVVMETSEHIFKKAGLNIHNNELTLKVWTEDLKLKSPYSMPSKNNLVKLGKKLNVDYVCAGVINWKIRTPWVLLGPKTKAICHVSYKIVDVKKEHLILDVKNLQADSTKKENGWEIAGDILLNPIATMVSGGPKVPHMKRSGQVATYKALYPFLKKVKVLECCAHKKKSCCTDKKEVITKKHVQHEEHPKKVVHTETTHTETKTH